MFDCSPRREIAQVEKLFRKARKREELVPQETFVVDHWSTCLLSRKVMGCMGFKGAVRSSLSFVELGDVWQTA